MSVDTNTYVFSRLLCCNHMPNSTDAAAYSVDLRFQLATFTVTNEGINHALTLLGWNDRERY
jgi:hypothetical protein